MNVTRQCSYASPTVVIILVNHYRQMLSTLYYRSLVVGVRGTGVQHKCSGCEVIKLVFNLRLAAI